MPQVALLHTWAGEDQCRVNPLQRYYLSHTHWAIIIIIIIIIRDNEKGTCMLIDVALSGDRNVIKKEAEKILK